MNDISRVVILVALALLFALLFGISLERSLAQPDSGYGLEWWTVDGGGGVLAGVSYTLTGTAGQPDAGEALEGSAYTLESGFWPAPEKVVIEPPEKVIYLPLVLQK